MRKQLFQVTLDTASGALTFHVVATDPGHAAEIVDHHAGESTVPVAEIKRVDDHMPQEQREGLDALLKVSPPGLASWSRQLGWVMHAAAIRWLRLYRAEDEHGAHMFMIAPNRDVASALYVNALPLAEGESRLFRIVDCTEQLPDEQIHNLPALIEFGPAGIVEFDHETGWSHT